MQKSFTLQIPTKIEDDSNGIRNKSCRKMSDPSQPGHFRAFNRLLCKTFIYLEIDFYEIKIYAIGP
jgi:hypothetical protein